MNELRSAKLKDLIGEAKQAVLSEGTRREGQRGTTFSASGVKLVWENPLADEGSYFYWDKESDEWYQDVFVRKEGNQPERLATKNSIVFPYKYAHRSRFYDGGWGYLLAVLKATEQTGKALAEILQSQDNFLEYLTVIGEKVHLQIVMAIWTWMGKEQSEYFLSNLQLVEKIVQRSRADTLERLAQETKNEPSSKRLVTPSFVYYQTDQGLDVITGIPPYQMFQILPSASKEPISSIHYHRSLDASGGVQLDFHHDLDWLKFVADAAGRKVGSISILAGDFHVYSEEGSSASLFSKTTIEDWLKAVTDGYNVGHNAAKNLLMNKDFYKRNAQQVYEKLIA